MKQNAEQEKSLMVPDQIDPEKLKKFHEETKDVQTWVRLSKSAEALTINGDEDNPVPFIQGIVMDFHPNWTWWPDDEDEPPVKKYQDDPPDDEKEWSRRCDLEMLTPEHGKVIVDLPLMAYRKHFRKYLERLELFGYTLPEVWTIAKAKKDKTRKHVFNTFVFDFKVRNEQREPLRPMIEVPKATDPQGPPDAPEFNPPPPKEDDIGF